MKINVGMNQVENAGSLRTTGGMGIVIVARRKAPSAESEMQTCVPFS